jgi:ABC-type bacteriocin/lantibiotic exporter with double-glycine peptidase domain
MYAVISAARGEKLNTETAFTTMAILSMVTHPTNMIMTIVPRAVAAFAGFGRIQNFLLQPDLQANRETIPRTSLDKNGTAIQIRQLRIGNEQALLDNINIDIAASSFTVISGPTGSGKSTLLRAILGEVTPAKGSTSLSTQQIAYCAQKPWLPNGTLREAIYGETGISTGTAAQDHESWYSEIIGACCLTHDFDSLPQGDKTQIGSRGLNLSGGQRHRVVCMPLGAN